MKLHCSPSYPVLCSSSEASSVTGYLISLNVSIAFTFSILFPSNKVGKYEFNLYKSTLSVALALTYSTPAKDVKKITIVCFVYSAVTLQQI